MNVGQRHIGLVFRDRQQPKMALRHLQAFSSSNDAQHPYAEPLDGLRHNQLVRIRSDLIENDSSNFNRGIILLKTQYERRSAFPHRAAVDHQYDRRIKQTGNRRRACHTAASAVKQAHDSFNHSDIHAAGSCFKDRKQAFRRHEPAVEVVTGTAGGESVVARIDIVRSHFVGLHLQTVPPQFGQQPAHDCGLADAALSSGHNNPGNLNFRFQYSIPRLPQIP